MYFLKVKSRPKSVYTGKYNFLMTPEYNFHSFLLIDLNMENIKKSNSIFIPFCPFKSTVLKFKKSILEMGQLKAIIIYFTCFKIVYRKGNLELI